MPMPSTYMSYNKALALGNQLFKQRNVPSSDAQPGDVARAYRTAPQGAKTKVLTLTQDNSGKISSAKAALESVSESSSNAR